MGSACVKAHDDIAVFIGSNRELCFITIVKWFLHSVDWFHHSTCILCATDSLQTIFDLIPLILQLLFIGNVLHSTTTTAPSFVTFWHNTKSRWSDNLHQPSICIRLLHLDNADTAKITHHSILYEYCDTVDVTNALTIISHVFYLYFIFLILYQHISLLLRCVTKIALKHTIETEPFTIVCIAFQYLTEGLQLGIGIIRIGKSYRLD